MLKHFLVASVATVLAASAAAQAVPAQAAPSRSDLTWGACPTDVSGPYPHLTCATLDVPRDHAHPAAGALKLTLTRLPAKDPAKRRGSLLLNPGGPGSSTISYLGRLTKPDATGATRLPKAVLDTYDMVGFDVRGLTRSSPISCVDPSFATGPLPDADDPAQRAKLWSRSESYSQACRQKAGDLLSRLDTPSVAKDMDLIRVALGEKKISYLGFSYGTYLGSTYATLFPSHLDRMVLDGVMNPALTDLFYQATLAQAEPVYRRFLEWQTWTAKYDSVFHLGTDAKQVRAAWDRTIAALRKAPHGQVGPSELISLTFGISYGESGWAAFAQAIGDFTLRNDDRALVGMAEPNTSAAGENSNAVFHAVTCQGSSWPKDHAKWERDAAARQAKAPLAGWWNSFSTAACASWPVANQQRVLPTGRGLGPVLIFGNMRDPSTPHAGAVKMHRLLPSSRLVSIDSGRHCEFAAAGLEANPRVNQIGADYLVNGTLPAQDIRVPGHALPDPTKTRFSSHPTDVSRSVH